MVNDRCLNVTQVSTTWNIRDNSIATNVTGCNRFSFDKKYVLYSLNEFYVIRSYDLRVVSLSDGFTQWLGWVFRDEVSTFGTIFFPCHLTKKPWNTYSKVSIVFLPAAEAQRASPGLLGITRGCSFELIYKVDSACRLHTPERPSDTSRSPIEILYNGNTRVYAMETKSALTYTIAKYFGVYRLPELALLCTIRAIPSHRRM